MKFFRISIMMLLVVAISCDYEDERLDFLKSSDSRPGQYYAWDDADLDTVSVSEGGSVEIRVESPLAPTTTPTIVTIEVSGTAAAEFGTGVTVENTTIVGEETAGELSVSGNIITATINNADTLTSVPMDIEVSVDTDDIQDGTKYLVFTITSVTRGGETLGIGTPAGEKVAQTVEIQDIDCGFARDTYDVNGNILVDDFGSGPFNNVETVLSTNCPTGTEYAIDDITGGLYGDPSSPYVANYSTTARATVITINETSGAVTWPTVSDQFGGNIVEDPAAAESSNYNSTTGVVTIYWTATAFGERGITTFTPQ